MCDSEVMQAVSSRAILTSLIRSPCMLYVPLKSGREGSTSNTISDGTRPLGPIMPLLPLKLSWRHVSG